MESNVKTHKPCCPKEFFAKLYGHLDDEKVKRNDPGRRESTLQFTINSGSSNKLTKFQILNDVRGYDELEENIFRKADILKKIPPSFPFLSTIISKNVSNFYAESAFTAGVTAFLARRRRKEGRPRRQRTTFSSEQTLSLELEYHRSEYISRGRRFELAETLRLTEAQIKIWFQNRRAKDKRIEKAQIDHQYRNFLLRSGIGGFSIPQNNINFCGMCIYRNKLPSVQCEDSKKVAYTCCEHLQYHCTSHVPSADN